MTSQTELGARLERLGMTKASLARAAGVKASAVSNWISRGSVPAEVEALLAKAEASGVSDEVPPLDSKVRCGGSDYRVIRRSRHECLFGSTPLQWTLVLAHVKGEWHIGPTMEVPARMVTLVESEPVWAEPKRSVREKE